jgi:hypothetical protein
MMVDKVRSVERIQGRINKFRNSQVKLRRRIWQRWKNPAGFAVPAFLVGCGRSGTSMLVYHLSKSWQTELYNEDNPAAFNKWRLKDFALIEDLVKSSNARVVLFKPILDTYQIRNFLTHFPSSRAIFAFRYYDDVINSSIKRFGVMNRINHVNVWIEEDFREFSEAPPPEATKEFIRERWNPTLSPESGAALYWLFQNRLFLDLGLDREERVKLVRYESVAADPFNEFQSLCQFLGIDFDPKISEGVFSSSIKRDPAPNIDPCIREECEALWKQLTQYLEVK